MRTEQRWTNRIASRLTDWLTDCSRIRCWQPTGPQLTLRWASRCFRSVHALTDMFVASYVSTKTSGGVGGIAVTEEKSERWCGIHTNSILMLFPTSQQTHCFSIMQRTCRCCSYGQSLFVLEIIRKTQTGVVQQVTLRAMAGVCACARARAQYFWIFCCISWNDSSVLIAKQTAGPHLIGVFFGSCESLMHEVWTNTGNISCRSGTANTLLCYAWNAVVCPSHFILDPDRIAGGRNIGILAALVTWHDMQQLHWLRLKIA